MNTYNSILELIGGTPLLRLNNLEKQNSLDAAVFAKLECFNPAGSVKDRAALSMIEDAERTGKLKKGATIIEPTSGNTGIGLAVAAAVRGYKVILTMPDSMSEERRNLLAAYGAELVLTDGKKGMSGAIQKADELKKSIDGSIIMGQFTNPANAKAHYDTTGPEIYSDLNGKVDIFVAGVGTGGTLTGIGRYLKEQKGDIKVIAVEPADSAVLSGGSAGVHGLQGIGAGFVPEILDTDIIDEVITVTNEDAYKTTKTLPVTEGVLVGISSGAALFAAMEIAKRAENKGKNIVVLLPDTGERYLSTEAFK